MPNVQPSTATKAIRRKAIAWHQNLDIWQEINALHFCLHFLHRLVTNMNFKHPKYIHNLIRHVGSHGEKEK